jgi:hypothetical protein
VRRTGTTALQLHGFHFIGRFDGTVSYFKEAYKTGANLGTVFKEGVDLVSEQSITFHSRNPSK